MQNKVMHIIILFPTIKCLTTKFSHYTYTILHILYTTSAVNCRTNNITLDENDTHMKILPGKALLRQCLHLLSPLAMWQCKGCYLELDTVQTNFHWLRNFYPLMNSTPATFPIFEQTFCSLNKHLA